MNHLIVCISVCVVAVAALHNLAVMYESGKFGVPQDQERANQFYYMSLRERHGLRHITKADSERARKVCGLMIWYT